MARRDFVSIPAVPDDIKQQFPGLAAHLSVLGENIELLAGLRGASDNYAVLKGDVAVAYPASVTATASSVQSVIDDLTRLQTTVSTLLAVLKSN